MNPFPFKDLVYKYFNTMNISQFSPPSHLAQPNSPTGKEKELGSHSSYIVAGDPALGGFEC